MVGKKGECFVWEKRGIMDGENVEGYWWEKGRVMCGGKGRVMGGKNGEKCEGGVKGGK